MQLDDYETRGFQASVQEQNPVFFDSLVLPNPRGLVREKPFKEKIYNLLSGAGEGGGGGGTQPPSQ